MKITATFFTCFICLLGGQAQSYSQKTDHAVSDTRLETSFQNPPPAARPWVYYFPLNGNLTKEGITADFEAMERVGIGGILYMEVNQGTPAGSADFAGPLWMELISHACSEAKRLGLEINMNNDAGWNGSGGPWITPELSMQTVVWSELMVEGTNQLPLVLPQPKAVNDFYQDIAVLAMPAPKVDSLIYKYEIKSSATKGVYTNSSSLPADFKEIAAGIIIPRSEIIELTSKMDREGKLNWTPPAGKWLVMRFGHTTTGKVNHPAPATGMGLECDKLSKAAAKLHFDNLMGKIVQQNRALTGQDKPLVGVHIDSWENGAQNWTPLMREEFRKRRGYDILTFFPVLSGRTVGSTEVSERYLWDLRQTVSELLIENYAGTFRELAHKNNLRLTIEAYGEPADNMAYASQADEPMGEFWSWGKFGHAWSCTEMASASHIYGKQIVGAEAFTSGKTEKWQSYPGNIKDLGDWAFCEGINRFVFHRYAAQPFIKASPGVSMGPWGLHYERTQTWWEQAKAWHEYLSRCQSILQQGQYVADILYLAPEGSPREFHAPEEAEIAPNIRSGYGFDGCSTDAVLNRLSVKDGKIVLPDGMSYQTLVLPPAETMSPALLNKIRQLAEEGAMIVGSKTPPRKSPSLTDMGAGDASILKTAAGLWTSGKILTGKTAQQFLSERGVSPDFVSSIPLRWIHRRIGDADVYFVANPNPSNVEVTADFRITGRQPELWHPDNGHMECSVTYQERKDITRIHLNFEPNGSVFVVFRKPPPPIDPVIALKWNGKLLWSMDEVKKSKITIIKASYGVPGDPKRTRNVIQKVQTIIDRGSRNILVSSMAKGDDPAFGVVKTLTVEFLTDGKFKKVSGTDQMSISLESFDSRLPAGEISWDSGNKMILLAHEAGKYELQTAGGKTRIVNVKVKPESLAITGLWKVYFDPVAGGPGGVTFSKLDDWSKRPETGIKYYSGTAVYKKTFVAPVPLKTGRVMLDLGKVSVMAEVRLNGLNLGTLWKQPYQLDITDAIRPGENQLEINVVNLCINRQIGDEHLPEDSDRKPDGTLNSWPEWMIKEQPSPTGRFSFTSWRLWKKDDPLVESGLLGPVTIQTIEKYKIDN